jgi:hypothetical protein
MFPFPSPEREVGNQSSCCGMIVSKTAIWRISRENSGEPLTNRNKLLSISGWVQLSNLGEQTYSCGNNGFLNIAKRASTFFVAIYRS